jgi:adenylate cyclase
VLPKQLPFLTDTVAKAKKRREALRIFALAVASSIIAALSTHQAAQIPRFVVIEGIPFGLILVITRMLIPLVKMRSVGWMILFRATAYTILFILAIALSLAVFSPPGKFVQVVVENRRVIYVVLGISYFWMIIVLGTRGVARKLGSSAFWNWIRGYYFTPKEEERIFMFLDMRRSTELAETLGDMKFSKLVRDFFEDLTGPIVETRAEVSHYIGDEAVLTWWPKKGLPEARCLQCFFRMQAVIAKRHDYYKKEYGVVPEFKAGAHIGRVVATEVGQIKSEIVYHGDVLNTTARVQGACGEFGADFLITEALAQRIPATYWLDLQPIGGVALKGKSEKVNLLSATVKTK